MNLKTPEEMTQSRRKGWTSNQRTYRVSDGQDDDVGTFQTTADIREKTGLTEWKVRDRIKKLRSDGLRLTWARIEGTA